MIRFASAIDEDAIPDKPLDSCKYLQLQDQRTCQIRITPSAQSSQPQQSRLLSRSHPSPQDLPQALYHGEFLWADSSSPRISPLCNLPNQTTNPSQTMLPPSCLPPHLDPRIRSYSQRNKILLQARSSSANHLCQHAQTATFFC